MKSFKKNLLWLYYVFPCYTSDNECIHSLPSNILQQTINTEYIFISLHKWIFILPQKRYIACVKNTKACKTNVGVSVWRQRENERERPYSGILWYYLKPIVYYIHNFAYSSWISFWFLEHEWFAHLYCSIP